MYINNKEFLLDFWYCQKKVFWHFCIFISGGSARAVEQVQEACGQLTHKCPAKTIVKYTFTIDDMWCNGLLGYFLCHSIDSSSPCKLSRVGHQLRRLPGCNFSDSVVQPSYLARSARSASRSPGLKWAGTKYRCTAVGAWKVVRVM